MRGRLQPQLPRPRKHAYAVPKSVKMYTDVNAVQVEYIVPVLVVTVMLLLGTTRFSVLRS